MTNYKYKFVKRKRSRPPVPIIVHQEKVEPQANKREKFTVIHLFGLTAAGSSIVVFLAAFGSWAFGRGLAIGLGIPSSVLSISNSIELFTAVGVIYVSVLVVVIIVGSVIGTLILTRAWFLIIATLVWMIDGGLIFYSFEERLSPDFVSLCFGALFVTAIWSGIHSGSRGDLGLKVYTGGVYALACLLLFSTCMYELGTNEAEKLLWQKGLDSNDRGMKPTRLEDYPLVSIVSREPLSMVKTKPKNDKELFLYEMSDSSFIRFFMNDKDRDFFIERMGDSSFVYAIQRSDIVSLRYEYYERE